jgi:hypothetical protein
MDWESTKVSKAKAPYQGGKGRDVKTKDFICYRCGRPGHLARNCTSEKETPKKAKVKKSRTKESKVKKSKPSPKPASDDSSEESTESGCDQTSDDSGKE